MKTNGKQTHDQTGTGFSGLKEAGREILDEASQLFKKKTAELREKGLKQSIQDHPIKSAFIALGVGIIIGMILKRKD